MTSFVLATEIHGKHGKCVSGKSEVGSRKSEV